MKSVRQIINDRMKERGLNAYDVAMLVKDEMSPQTVYNFVKGRSEMNTKSLASVLGALALEIRPISDASRDTKTGKTAVSKRKSARRGASGRGR